MKRTSKPNVCGSSGLAETTNLPESMNTTTPKNHKTSLTNGNFNSPIFSPYSQEELDKFDVIWDWSSSNTNTRPRKHKRLDFTESPKLPIKRPPSNNQIEDFLKLKEELESLRDDILRSKQESTTTTNKTVMNLNDIFDDSMEDQLVICSQEVENQIKVNLNHEVKIGDTISTSTLHNVNSNIKSTEVTNILSQLDDALEQLANDSFDLFVHEIEEQDSKYGKKESENTKSKSTHAKTTTIEAEIERKRQEALMKLESKKKQTITESDSPIKCSPEEIEQKRLQALARLKEKKKQEVIERNRLEALKRLEMNKKKRAMKFDSSSIFYKLNR